MNQTKIVRAPQHEIDALRELLSELEEDSGLDPAWRRIVDGYELLVNTLCDLDLAYLDLDQSVKDILEPDRPVIVCLCGSTRFWRTFQKAGLQETLAGKIVLSIGAASGTDDEHFGNLPQEEYDRIKEQLDRLHLHKVELAHEVLILNVGGYIGESTQRELDYARSLGRVIRYWEHPIDCEYCRLKEDLEDAEAMRDRTHGAESEAWDIGAETIASELAVMLPCERWRDRNGEQDG